MATGCRARRFRRMTSARCDHRRAFPPRPHNPRARYYRRMHSIASASSSSLRRALEDFKGVLNGLPDAAVDWSPLPGLNTIGVLTRHSLSAAGFLVETATGQGPDRQAYFEGPRAQSFRTHGVPSAALAAEVDEACARFEALLAGAGEEALFAPAPWSMPDGATLSGVELLFLAVGHVKEHVGHAEIMRDLWLANSREGH